MKVGALASGSNGNCYFIENENRAVLIDAGISCKKITLGLESWGINPRIVEGIFITHEHSDHVIGADVFARTFNVPVFATKKTHESKKLCSDNKLIHEINKKDSLNIAGMEVEAFSKSHGAVDPVSFSISNGKKRTSVITDVGYACKNVCSEISDADSLFLESNYDDKMLDDGPYHPWHKKWVKGDEGHLSNLQASLAVLEFANPKLDNVILSHLSGTNNIPELARKTFLNLMKERNDWKGKLHVAERGNIGKLIKV